MTVSSGDLTTRVEVGMVAPSIDQTCLNQPVEPNQSESVSFRGSVGALIPTPVNCENESHSNCSVGSFQEEARLEIVEVPNAPSYFNRVVPDIASNNSLNKPRKATMNFYNLNKQQLGSVTSQSSAGASTPARFEPQSSGDTRAITKRFREQARKERGTIDIGRIFDKEYERLYGNKRTFQLVYVEKCATDKYVINLKKGLCMRVSDEAYIEYVDKYANVFSTRSKFYKRTYKQRKFFFMATSLADWQPQSLIGNLTETFNTITNTIASSMELLTQARTATANMMTKSFRMFLIDILALMVSLRDGFLTAGKVAATLLSLYTLHQRYMQIFHSNDYIIHEGRKYVPQTATITDILLGFAALGLSDKILNALKTFTSLTGKRIFDSDIVMETLHTFFESIITIIHWIAEPVAGFRILPLVATEYLVSTIQYLASGVYVHKQIKSVCENYTKYCTNPQIMFDPTYRQKLMEEYKKLKGNAQFMEYVSNANNKYFATTWTLYENNVIKSIVAFEESRREEPICIVFEGEAGSGKSMVMNQFVDLLRQTGLTTYCHSIPASEDGKDFYDDYDNQDIFVIDDLGQQGKSQWRYIINFVSPVKYPLPCATATKKNTKFFNSKVILCTTNHFMTLGGFTSSDCITEPEALYRRCHVIRIDRDPNITDKFAQIFQYHKFDHIGSKRWETHLLHHCQNDSIPTSLRNGIQDFTGDDIDIDFNQTERSLAFIYRLYKHIVRAEDANRNNTAISVDSLKKIMTRVDEEYVPQSYYDMLTRHMRGFIAAGSSACDIAREWLGYYGMMILDIIKEGSRHLVDCASSLIVKFDELEVVSKMLFSGGILLLFGYFLWNMLTTGKEITPNKLDLSFTNLDPTLPLPPVDKWLPQASYPERIEVTRRNCRTVVIKHDSQDREQDEYSQVVVSGAFLLLPAHVSAHNKYVDLYQTPEHYANKHVEIENVKIELIKMYPACDLAVYKIMNHIPLYKKCNNLFLRNENLTNPLLYLVNSSGVLPVLYGSSVLSNNEKVSYTKYAAQVTHYDHAVASGFITPYSKEGACGTVLVSAEHGIIGYHVAGGATCGFCVNPPDYVREDIRNIMLQGVEVNFDLDSKIIPDFSGVRVRYTEPIEQTFVSGETNYAPSILHRSVNIEMAALEKAIVDDSKIYTQVPVAEIDHKEPPNFSSFGNPKKTIKEISRKTFKRQGYITNAEFAYIEKCVDSMLIEFDDLDDLTCAFGDQDTPALNKDSSNGYHCEKGKDKYFNFERKEILPEAFALFSRIEEHARDGEYYYDDFMCRETFKDELRKSNKKDVPRTFRVMPLGHIWWTKKIFGKLMKHFKENMHTTGVCVGFNPYKDTAELARKLKQCSITGDADFGKWDGTVMAELIKRIIKRMQLKYRGKYTHVIDWLMATIAHSFVLVTDEIWATTHGLPSGTWLTLLLNCLINKSLTALTIYRNKKDATVDDFYSIVDYVVGDDKIIGANNNMAKVFNLLTIKETAESLGMECTNGDKTPITKASHPFENLTFVKRHFRQHPTLKRYIGNLSLDTILNMVQWQDMSKDAEETMEGKMRAAQVEAYIHSPALYAQLTKIFENSFPFAALFTAAKIEQILSRDDAYKQVLAMQQKSAAWLYLD